MSDLAETSRERNNRISLQHYFETLLVQYKEAHITEHRLLAENVVHAREAMDVRLESMNQFREQIQTERGMMLTKDKFDAEHNVLLNRMRTVEAELSSIRGRMGAIGAALGVGLVVLELVLEFVVK